MMTQSRPEEGRAPPLRARGAFFGWLDIVLLAAALVVCGYFVWRTNVQLHYRWNWSVIWPWVARFEDKEGFVAGPILVGLAVTLRLAVWGILLATMIGVVMGFARTSRRLFFRLVASGYVMLIRNIPPLVFVFVFVFFITSQVLPALGVSERVKAWSPATQWVVEALFGPVARLENFLVGLICLAVFTGAYVTEIVRAGLQSVPRAQIEAGESLGLSAFDVRRYVVFPQALKNVVPALSNQFIQMIKDSSLVSLVSVQELAFMAQDIQTSTRRVFEVLLFVGALYFIICWSLSLLFARLEHRNQS
ncbi:MAG: amino acid ABC transporter permease [Methylobacteriaceae bacterium]|nr:amino acid ABC transporter permease [Methylobacteriaceae bacterium]